MSDLICRKTMQRCLTPGMCSTHGGCRPEKSEWQSGYDEGRRMGVRTALAERDQLKAENEDLRKDAERYRGLRDGDYLHSFISIHPCDEHKASEITDQAIDRILEIRS